MTHNWQPPQGQWKRERQTNQRHLFFASQCFVTVDYECFEIICMIKLSTMLCQPIFHLITLSSSSSGQYVRSTTDIALFQRFTSWQLFEPVHNQPTCSILIFISVKFIIISCNNNSELINLRNSYQYYHFIRVRTHRTKHISRMITRTFIRQRMRSDILLKLGTAIITMVTAVNDINRLRTCFFFIYWGTNSYT